jgi:hypothetical protein
MIADGHPWFAELAGPKWSFLELTTGHWPMFSVPDQLAELLNDLPDVALSLRSRRTRCLRGRS